jgi:hypothetical protein
MPTYRSAYQKKLVDAVFFEQDQELRKRFRERLERLDQRTQLAQVSGIHDEVELDRLIELGIGPETLAAMAIVPLVYVAWADKQVQPRERKVIIEAAEAAGIPSSDGRYPLLDYWLNKRPDANMIDAWKHHIKSLCERITPDEVDKLKRDLLDLAEKVAQAAGGVFGFGEKVSPAERRALDELKKAFL